MKHQSELGRKLPVNTKVVLVMQSCSHDAPYGEYFRIQVPIWHLLKSHQTQRFCTCGHLVIGPNNWGNCNRQNICQKRIVKCLPGDSDFFTQRLGDGPETLGVGSVGQGIGGYWWVLVGPGGVSGCHPLPVPTLDRLAFEEYHRVADGGRFTKGGDSRAASMI